MDVDREHANRVLGADPEFQQLRARFNALGILRFLIWAGAAILAIVSGANEAWGVLVVGLLVSFGLVMTVEYNRAATLSRQQGRAMRLGLIREDDLR